MTEQLIQEQWGRVKYEAAECMNKTGAGLTAGLRFLLLFCMVTLLCAARFCGLLDEQLAERTNRERELARVAE